MKEHKARIHRRFTRNRNRQHVYLVEHSPYGLGNFVVLYRTQGNAQKQSFGDRSSADKFYESVVSQLS